MFEQHPVRNIVVSFFAGMMLMGLLLDGRAVAIWQAVSNPQAVNAVSFKTEVIVKK